MGMCVPNHRRSGALPVSGNLALMGHVQVATVLRPYRAPPHASCATLGEWKTLASIPSRATHG